MGTDNPARTRRSGIRAILSATGRLVSLSVAIIVAALFLSIKPSLANSKYAAIVIDAATGEVFHEDGADRRLYPASLTKMMTLYLTFQALERGELRLDQRIPVSAAAAAQPPSKIGIPAGGRIKVEDAILSLVTKSANDIAVALAEAIGGSERGFARMMTDEAQRLGMTRTRFRNASGLPDDSQVSTARDMARLAQALIYDYPAYYSYFSTPRFRFAGHTFRNHNRLMDSYEGMDGLKTGYIRASGYNLVASAKRGNLRLIAVVFGGRSADTRNARVAELLDLGFGSRRGRNLIANGSPGPAPRTRQLAMAEPPPLPPRRPAVAGDAPADLGVLIAAASPAAPLADHGRSLPVAGAGAESEPLAAVAFLATDWALPAETPRPNGIARLPLPPHLPPFRLSPVTVASIEEGDAALDGETASEALGLAAAPEAADGSWSIQLGAFPSPDEGTRTLERASASIAPQLGPAQPRVIEVAVDGRTLYRARFVGLGHAAAARACAAWIGTGGDCFTVPPGASF